MSCIIRRFCVFLVLFLIFSCGDEKLNTEKKISNELNSLGINSKVLVNNDNKVLSINISLQKPYIIFDLEHQNVLISFVVHKTEKYLVKYDKVKFKIYLDKEEEFNSRSIEYENQEINEINNYYTKNPLFFNIVEYCLSSLNSNDVTALNIDLQFMNEKFPNETTNYPFFKFLEHFSIEASYNDIGKNSKSLILIYFFKKNVLNKASGEYKEGSEREVKLISDIWEIAKKSSINLEKSKLAEIFDSVTN